MVLSLLTILPGVGSMDNIHPLFVHFPIALFSAFLIAEFVGVVFRKEDFRCAASFTLYLGTIAALFTVAAGYYAAATVEHPEVVHPIMERHEHLGVTVLVLAIILSVWRIRSQRRFSPRGQFLHILLAFILCVVIAFGADLGGLMVYRYGVGGQAVKAERARLTSGTGDRALDLHAHEAGEEGHHHHHHHHGG